MSDSCGLLTKQKAPVPLKKVEVEVCVRGHVASVTSTLQYENQETKPLEAVFVFPMPAEAALCHFSAKIGEREVQAELKEKQEAREEYDDALSSGDQAFLLEESEQSSDVFRLSVGSLPPGESASVTLTYVTELDMQADDALRFCLPAVLNPRYAPANTGSVPEVTSVPAGTIPYTLSLTMHLSSPYPITRVQSSCDLQPLKYLDAEQKEATVSLSPDHKFDRDVEMLVYYSNAHQPFALVEAGKAGAQAGSLMGDPSVMLGLYPEFPQAVTSSLASCGEFIFLVDRSGSMEMPMHSAEGAQERIETARDTLLLLLKSLPLGCYFNIYGFGSQHESFFPSSVEYNQENMEKALEKVQGLMADMGGTEILRPLEDIYKQPCIPAHPRQVFVFTDGEVWNTKEIVDLVKTNAFAHRCFTFGIGEGASSALITDMAKVGSGHAQFITGTDRLQPKVMQSLRFALQPAVKNISVKWDLPAGMSVSPISPTPKVLFHGQRSLIYTQLSGKCKGEAEASVLVQYTLGEQAVENQLCFSLKPVEDAGLTAHRLGARTLIRSLEKEARDRQEAEGGAENQKEEVDAIKKRIVELSIQSGVSSTFTSFIALSPGSRDAAQGPMQRRHIPTASFCRGGSMPMAMMCCSAPVFMPRMGSLGIAMAGTVMDMSPDLGDDDGEGAICAVPKVGKDLLLELISLQKASGCWDVTPGLAEIFGKAEEELDKQEPAQVDRSLWGTVLALLWLYGFRLEMQEEWQFVAMKAVNWIKAQKGVGVSQCVRAGCSLLGCNVQEVTLGL